MEDPKVSAWLGELGLERYAPAFAEAQVDFDTLSELTVADLREIGVDAVGPRRRLEAAVTRLRRERAGMGRSTAFIGARRHLTILFCDVVGSTALSQRFDAEQMSQMFRAYYAVVTRVLERRGGHEANRLGDGSFIFFGYPQAREHAALQAVLTAREILGETFRLVRDPGGDPLSVRAGLASGMVVLNHADTTNVFGETANIAARVQSLAGAGEVVIADSTARLVRDQVALQSLGTHELRGIEEPMQAWRVLPDDAHPAPDLEPGASPLVGRDQELAALSALWAQARAGLGHCVYVSGEAGIGKSRLVAELTGQARAEGARTRLLRCSSEFVDSPFFPFLREASGAGVSSEMIDDELEAALREPERNEALHLIRDRRESLIRGFVRRALGRDDGTPLLICFEDIHWADPSSIEVLTRLRGAIARRRVMLVVTGREPEPLTGLSVDATVALEPLAAEDSREVVVAALAAHSIDAPAQVIAEIAQRSDGMPFFAEELALSFAQAAARRDAAASLADVPASLADVPASLQEALQFRVDGLEVGAELLELAAIFGRELPMDVLGALIPSRPTREAALAELSDAGLLSVAGTGADDGSSADMVVFRHQLVLAYVYDTILRERRASLHARVADVLERRSGTAPETLAYHEEHAGRGERAAHSWAEAGRRAASRSADAEAATYFRRALQLLSQFADQEVAERFEVDVLLDFLPALLGSDGYVSAATSSVNRVVELTTRRSLPEQGFNAMFLRWIDQLARGNIDVAHGLGLELQPLASRLGSDTALLLIDRMLGSTHLFRGELNAASEALERFARSYDPDRHAAALAEYGATDNYTTVQCCRICVAVLMGRPQDGRRLQDATVAEALRIGRVHNLCHVLAYGGAIGSALAQDWDAMDGYVQELHGIAATRELPFWEATVSFFEGIGVAYRGEPARGREIFDHGADWFTRNGSGFLLPTFRVLLASATADAGFATGDPVSRAAADGLAGEDPVSGAAATDLAGGDTVSATSVAASARYGNDADDLLRLTAGLSSGERWVRPELLRLRGLEELRRGDTETATRLLEQAVTLALEQGAELMAARAGKLLVRPSLSRHRV